MGRRGGRGGGSKGGGGEPGGFSDQYGEAMRSQDRDEFHGAAGRGGGSMGGGGEAGGGGRRGLDLSVAKHVPKFLQAHSHLLHKGPKPDEPRIVKEQEDSDIEDYDGGALAQAIADNPELAAEHPELVKKANKARAVDEKELGNRAFGAKEFSQAVVHFSRCIELDPENEIYFSNRSAANAALKRWDEALRDGRRAVQLKPGWAKGYARLGAAFLGMELWSEAKEAYQKALDFEPDDAQLRVCYDRADVQDRKAAESKRHKFKSRDLGLRDGPDAKRQRPEKQAAERREVSKDQKSSRPSLLSFDDDG